MSRPPGHNDPRPNSKLSAVRIALFNLLAQQRRDAVMRGPPFAQDQALGEKGGDL